MTERRYSAPAQRELRVSHFRKNLTKCLRRAELCRWEAKEAPNAFEEEAWLNYADLWTDLADAFEEADQPTLH